ncbi:MAG TPA: transglutaminase-like domain-containing protein [Blastocatellia bacterium]|nr:transglutaminase-like domain-containing protein [Blastocatellia bacterium]
MTDTRERFDSDLSDLAGLSDNDIPLASSALRLALPEYPELDHQRWLSELDRLAARAREIASGRSPSELLDALDATLFDEHGLHGNATDYFDPRNSFLNDVLETRSGIPISLAVIYIETGRRLGLQLEGIGFPGHFLVGHFANHDVEFIDCFNRGARLGRSDCVDLLVANGGSADLFDESCLEPVTHRQILLRMLANLKLIYLKRSDYARAVGAIDRILQLAPDMLSEVRDRGLVLLQSGNAGTALHDLEQYLDRSPAGTDLETVRKAMAAARNSLARLN